MSILLSLREPCRVSEWTDKKSGCTVITAINRRVWNPCVGRFTSLGGIRMPFPVYENIISAHRDARLLAQAMTEKALGANLDIGGGKTVVVGDPRTQKTQDFLLWLGGCLHALGGSYYGAEDVGTMVADMDVIRKVTPYVTGTSLEYGGSGDPSVITAAGILTGINIAAFFHPMTKSRSFNELAFAVQGLGHVGTILAEAIYRRGAKLTVADIDERKLDKFRAWQDVTIVSPDTIHREHVDFFVPCARGEIINNETVPQFNCHIIAGAANNQLESGVAGKYLWNERKILYAPDSIINVGGLINVLFEVERREPYNPTHAVEQTEKVITENLFTIFERAYAENVPPETIFDSIVKERYGNRIREGTVLT